MKKAMSLVLAAAMAFSFAACGGASGTSGATSTASGAASTTGTASGAAIKIGGIGPLTGGAAIYGNAVKNGAELAVEEINAQGGLQFELNFQDDENDPEKSLNAYNNLKDWGMQALLGTVTTQPCLTVAPETAADNMFLLTPSASAVDVIKEDNAFQVCFTDPNQGVASADYIADNGLATKIAIIYDSSDAYSSGIHDKFKEEAATKGLEIVADEAFTADNKTDFSVQVQKAKSSGAELVFLPIYYSEANLIIQEMNKQGCTASVFGCDGLDGLLTIEGADTSLFEGVMLLTPFAADAQDEKTQNFVSKYEEKYGETPNQFAADAYDGVYTILAACEQGGVTADMDASAVCDALKAAMTQITVDGLTGEGMKWEATGEVNKAPRAVKIQNGAYTAM
ncbi:MULTISPECIES: ABC transporter substrate-binding protein [Allofournierella]|uniref:ABC transporter substrate-binding protein n=2 Tax=Oscillospiraceae TaxID=216572 RepID=A0ABT7UUE0_9FIRM|nr:MULTISPECIES: ABC transporter substrate-binding protein [Fournierella]MDM8202503.1 ABC transporter substrate-binding protein [Fournierella massiliensis]OUN15472.1 amino acid ABC transporter substrate-binding protein [Gemmiger sp. An87]